MTNWKPIETAPVPTDPNDDERWYLVYDPEVGVRSARVEIDYRDSTVRWWAGDVWDTQDLHPTHWDELPPPPESSTTA